MCVPLIHIFAKVLLSALQECKAREGQVIGMLTGPETSSIGVGDRAEGGNGVWEEVESMALARIISKPFPGFDLLGHINTDVVMSKLTCCICWSFP